MRIGLFKFWSRIRSSFWFIPTLMTATAVFLASVTVAFDEALVARGTHVWGWIYNGGAEGAGAVLTAVSGSMITIAGLVFSMTLVAMSLAASNFGPRLLQNFMRDTANQVVLGTFVATFLYCLLVLRTIRRADEGAFVPHASVSLGVLLALTSIGVLIYFIHHVAVSIQADEIATRVGRELIAQVERAFAPELDADSSDGTDRNSHSGLTQPLQPEAVICSLADGYLQLIDAEMLLRLATQENSVFTLERRPGDYVVAGSPLLRIWPAARVREPLATMINSAFVLGNQRSADQDLGYLIGQLVEIAVRALSPGINDPFTAMSCIDRLSSALARLAQRETPSTHRYFDEHKVLRLITRGTTFAEALAAAFDPIRRYGRSSKDVSLRLLDALGTVAFAAKRPEDIVALRQHATRIARGAAKALPDRADRRAVLARHQSLVEEFDGVLSNAH